MVCKPGCLIPGGLHTLKEKHTETVTQFVRLFSFLSLRSGTFEGKKLDNLGPFVCFPSSPFMVWFMVLLTVA